MQNKAYTKQWNLELKVTELVNIFVKDKGKAFQVCKISKNWSLDEATLNYNHYLYAQTNLEKMFETK